jgi:ATP-dependent helicase HepA
MLETAHRAAEHAALERLGALREAALAQLRGHALAEEERLVAAGFQGGATREAVDVALEAVRVHRAATENALRRVRLELEAAAIVLPS